MKGEPPAARPARPVIPFIILGGLALLFLSWLAFMAHYLREEAYKRSLREAEPTSMGVDGTNPPGSF